MKVRDAMTPDVRTANPRQSICEAAQMMAEIDTGVIPVGENDRLVGMITDRDIAVRAVAQKKGPDTAIADIMTREIKYCFDDDDIEQVCETMAELKLRRLPVVDRGKRLVGILSLGDLAAVEEAAPVGDALRSISEPGGAHSQTTDGRLNA